jgi:hypothetical protein
LTPENQRRTSKNLKEKRNIRFLRESGAPKMGERKNRKVYHYLQYGPANGPNRPVAGRDGKTAANTPTAGPKGSQAPTRPFKAQVLTPPEVPKKPGAKKPGAKRNQTKASGWPGLVFRGYFVGFYFEIS